MSSSNSPCAACKCLRRKCTLECVFAPYFPPENPQKFTNVHKVFGASNVAKILGDLNANQREDAVNSLAYEAEYRLRDPVYGCVGLVSILQHKLKQVHVDLENARKELANYIGPSALVPIINHPGLMQQHPIGGYQVLPYNMQQQQQQQMMGVPHGGVVIQEPQQQMIEAQQLAAVAREQEMLRHYEQQQQQQQHQQNDQMIGLINGGFDEAGGGGAVTATGFNQMQAGTMQPSLALGGVYELVQQQPGYHSNAQAQQFQIQAQELLMQQEQQNVVVAQHHQQLVQQRDNSEEGRSNIGPSS